MKAALRLVALSAALSLVGFGCTTAAATPPPSGAATSSSAPAASPSVPADVSRAPSAVPTKNPSAVASVKGTVGVPHSLVPTLLHDRILYQAHYREWWTIRTNGTGKIKIADDFPQPQLSPGPLPEAVWAADGMKVHYVRFNVADNCRPELIDVNPWTGAKTPVLHANAIGGDMQFVWSPDGTRIAFTRSQNYQQCTYTSYGIDDIRDLMMMNADGTGLQTIKKHVHYSLTEWMPNGSAIVGLSDAGIVRVNPTTGMETMMVSGAADVSVSRDSSRLAYWSGGNLLVRSVNGGMSQNMGPASSIRNAYAWAPNGQALIVLRTISSGHEHPFLVPYPPGLVKDLGTDCYGPSWSPDNNHFVCLVNSVVKILNISGQPFTTIPNTTGAEMSAHWQP